MIFLEDSEESQGQEQKTLLDTGAPWEKQSIQQSLNTRKLVKMLKMISLLMSVISRSFTDELMLHVLESLGVIG